MTEHNVFTYARFLEAANPKTGQRRLRALAQLLLKKGCNSYADDHLAFALTSNKNLPRAVFAELGAEYPCGAVNNPYYVNHVLGAARQEDADYLRGFDKGAKEREDYRAKRKDLDAPGESLDGILNLSPLLLVGRYLLLEMTSRKDAQTVLDAIHNYMHHRKVSAPRVNILLGDRRSDVAKVFAKSLLVGASFLRNKADVSVVATFLPCVDGAWVRRYIKRHPKVGWKAPDMLGRELLLSVPQFASCWLLALLNAGRIGPEEALRLLGRVTKPGTSRLLVVSQLLAHLPARTAAKLYRTATATHKRRKADLADKSMARDRKSVV